MSKGQRLVALFSGLAVAAPFFAVRLPPITDLPQHVAQIRLFLDVWNSESGLYRVHWGTPYSLSYLLLGASWAAVGSWSAGRTAACMIALLCTAATHALAARFKRPAVLAVLATPFVFNHALYWGFLSFVTGWPAFALWLILLRRLTPSASWTNAVRLLVGALALYLSHALWLAAGLAWLVASTLLSRSPLRVFAFRGAVLLPVIALAALWYASLSATGFASPTVWETAPVHRISPSWLADSALGGLHGSMEPTALILLAGCAIAALWANRHCLREMANSTLLLAGLGFTLAALFLPDVHTNTIRFSQRWLTPGLVLLILGWPASRSRPVLVAALAFVASFSAITTRAWVKFEQRELSGLAAAVEAIPPRSHVLGLDFVKQSRYVKGRPFLQAYAYAQVVRGADIHMTFAGFSPSLVVLKRPRDRPWTPRLEWHSERVKPTDFQYFDFVLINATGGQHAQAAALRELEPVTREGRWRLYEVVR
jgi:hypothetical protein